MISCPAANEIKCVKPSIATVSPSWTSSATASCIVVTLLEGIKRVSVPLAIRGSTKDAELVAFDVGHDRPEGGLTVDSARRLLDVVDLGGSENAKAVDLLAHRAGRTHVEVDAVLRRLWLRDGL